MINRSEFKLLNPYYKDKPGHNISLNEFCIKVKHYLPSFPEDVIEQWIYEDFLTFASDGKWNIEYDRLDFELVDFDIDMLLKVDDEAKFYEHGVGIEFDNHYGINRLSKYIIENKTWPRPIIVLDSLNSKLDGYDFLKPFHLLEGNRRLLYIKRMLDKNMPVMNKHKVWLVTRK